MVSFILNSPKNKAYLEAIGGLSRKGNEGNSLWKKQCILKAVMSNLCVHLKQSQRFKLSRNKVDPSKKITNYL